MENQEGRILVKLMEPSICVNCRFGTVEQIPIFIVNQDRMGIRLQVHCKRGDCDNWVTDTKEKEE